MSRLAKSMGAAVTLVVASACAVGNPSGQSSQVGERVIESATLAAYPETIRRWVPEGMRTESGKIALDFRLIVPRLFPYPPQAEVDEIAKGGKFAFLAPTGPGQANDAQWAAEQTLKGLARQQPELADRIATGRSNMYYVASYATGETPAATLVLVGKLAPLPTGVVEIPLKR